ncbi:MAG: alpha-amylase family glycosyl hydrolase [Polyangiaceae bacterium]
MRRLPPLTSMVFGRTARFARALLSVALPLAVTGAAIAPQGGCVTLPAEATDTTLSTHVTDWRDEVLYQVLVDRFANGDVNNDFKVQPGALARFQGGDWRGLEEKIPYLKELGVTALWISPIVRNVETDADVDSYHGYWAQDLTDVNPHFGDLPALKSLSKRLHENGMKIILDVVTNHMGQVFYYDMNMNGHPDIYIGGTGSSSPLERVTEFDPDWDPRGVQASTSLGIAGRAPMIFFDVPEIHRQAPKPGILGTAAAYHGFGRIIDYNDDKQVMLGDFPGGLKDLATEVPEVRQTLVDVFAHWAEEVDFDGFRIDTVKHVEHEFWQVFTQNVRARLAAKGKKNFLMFGEIFDGRDSLIGSYTRPGELDSAFYFSQHFQVFRDVFQMAHDKTQQKGTQQIADLWAAKAKNYGTEPQENGIGVAPAKALVNFLDNHDRPRFLFDAANDTAALRNALTLLMTEEGMPCMYYGTEQEFHGGNDPANREVLWNTGFPTTGDTFRHFSKLARIRKKYAALRRGDLAVIYATTAVAEERDAGLFAFERKGGDAGADALAVVVMNTNARHPSAPLGGTKTLKTTAKPGSTLVDVLDPAGTTVTVKADGTLDVTVPAESAMILVPQGQE